jgi:hypothetical protein
MFVGRRCINAIEVELEDALACATGRVPTPYLEDDGTLDQQSAEEYHAHYGEPFTTAEAKAMCGLATSQITERFRRQIAIARECGPNTFKVCGQLTALYEAACKSVGVDPWPRGVSRVVI